MALGGGANIARVSLTYGSRYGGSVSRTSKPKASRKCARNVKCKYSFLVKIAIGKVDFNANF